jgi:hypothetical protein
MPKPILVVGTGYNKKYFDAMQQKFQGSDIAREYHIMIIHSLPDTHVEVLNADKLESQDIEGIKNALCQNQ